MRTDELETFLKEHDEFLGGLRMLKVKAPVHQLLAFGKLWR